MANREPSEADPGASALPLAEWLQAGSPAQTTVAVSADDELDEHYPALLRADAVVIEFPGFMDGRGFSIGSKLRELGFAGTLLAGGDVLSDQWEYLQRCGFSGIAGEAAGGTPDFSGISVHYQPR